MLDDKQFDAGLAFTCMRLCEAVYFAGDTWAANKAVASLQDVRQFHLDNDTHALVGKLDHGKTVLVFRGTGPFSDKNWLDDAEIELTEDPRYGSGKVHAGFAELTEALLDRVETSDARNEGRIDPASPLIIAGHSLGGAIAILTAARLAVEGRPPAATYTFGAPRVGNAAFAHDFEARNAQTQTPLFRFVYRKDLVATVPPRSDSYMHVGLKVPLDADGIAGQAQDGDNDADDIGAATDLIVERLRLLPRFVSDVPGQIVEKIPSLEQGVDFLTNVGVRLAPNLTANAVEETKKAAAELADVSPELFGDHFPARYIGALAKASTAL